jgi:hypothetical protein
MNAIIGLLVLAQYNPFAPPHFNGYQGNFQPPPLQQYQPYQPPAMPSYQPSRMQQCSQQCQQIGSQTYCHENCF